MSGQTVRHLTGGSESAEAAPNGYGPAGVSPALAPASPVPPPEPLVLALGTHILDCPTCNTRGRATCPEGRTLSDAAALAAQVEYERRKGWRA